MAPVSINSFLPGYSVEVTETAGNDVSNVTETPQGVPDARPVVETYKVQPVVWMFVTLGLCVVGLYFFLEE